MITVYYGCVPSNRSLPVGTVEYFNEPIPVQKNIAKDLGLKDIPNGQDLLMCPALKQGIKNLYKITAAYEYEIKWDGNYFSSSYYDQHFYDTHVMVRDVSNGFASLVSPGMVFFTDEKDLIAELLPAFYEKKPIYKGVTITGEYNIARHFRPLEWSFILSEPQTIKINPGDPLYYVRFKTDEKIIFKRFFITPELMELHWTLIKQRHLTSKIIPLTWYYDTVSKFYKKTFLKHIKQNLME